MSKTILKIENLSKQYRLGTVGTGTLSHDLNRWWHKIRGKEDPYLKIGDVNVREQKSNSKYVWALRDISFTVNKGEVIGIIGKNGAGKSTLLKIISQITSPTTGTVKSRGRIASLLEVGTGFHPELTGKENIYLNGAILGMTKAEIDSKFDEIVDFAGVERYINTPVKRYSSGMIVRLAFAVAAHLEPEILVIDEVLAVGDASFQKKAIGKIKSISKSDGRTVLFVSHNMSAVKNLCTRGIVLNNGNIVFDGKVPESIDYYSNISNEQITNTKKILFDNQFIELLGFKVFHKNRIVKNGISIELGDSLEFELILKANQNINDLSLAFDINNLMGEFFSHISNEDDAFFIEKINKNQEITIKILTGNVLYIPSFYSLNLWIGMAHVTTMLHIKEIFSFELVQSNFSKRTRELPKHSRVYLPTTWIKK